MELEKRFTFTKRLFICIVAIDMTFALPYPNSPTNGDAGDADPIRQNFQALAQGIQSFDGTQIQAASVQEAALASAINPRLRGSETLSSFVYTGCVWSSVSGLNGTMTGGTIYVNGYRTIVNSVGSNTFTASQDTYVAIDYLGNITYNPVANNAAAPSLPANSIWVAKVVTNASAISSVVQTGNDGKGNYIYLKTAVPSDFISFGGKSTTPTISTSNFSTTETVIASWTHTVPANCNAVLVLASIRVQAQDATTKDVAVRVDVASSSSTASSLFTSVNTFNGGNLPIMDFLPVTPAASNSFRLLAKTTNGNANASATASTLYLIPLRNS